MSKRAGRTRLTLSVALLFALAIGPALASDVSDGLKYYNHGNFEAARKAFQKALFTNKEDPRLHYCLANTLMRLKKVAEALREYHLCIHYGPGTIIAEQSESAIGAYERHAQPFDREKADEARREAVLRREEEHRQQASERIHRQAQLHAGLRASDAEGQRNAILSSASANAKRIRDEGEEAANSQSYVYRRRYWARQNAADIRKQAKEDSDALLKRAQQQAEEYDRDARERANRMSEAESNLNSQMLQPIGGSRMRLVPTGTNLYIRNYQ